VRAGTLSGRLRPAAPYDTLRLVEPGTLAGLAVSSAHRLLARRPHERDSMANTERAAELFTQASRRSSPPRPARLRHQRRQLPRDRAAGGQGFAEMNLCSDLVNRELSAMLERCFPAKYDEMVISKHNVSFGVCPHHLLP
jgi:hypothetical protein